MMAEIYARGPIACGIINSRHTKEVSTLNITLPLKSTTLYLLLAVVWRMEQSTGLGETPGVSRGGKRVG